jgi:Rieske [2Fe-2S] domain
MLTQEENERLTRVGPGTPMGELLRRYWHPIAAASEFTTGKFPLKRRLLGEDLVVFRTADGAYGAMEPVCPAPMHRPRLDGLASAPSSALTGGIDRR